MIEIGIFPATQVCNDVRVCKWWQISDELSLYGLLETICYIFRRHTWASQVHMQLFGALDVPSVLKNVGNSLGFQTQPWLWLSLILDWDWIMFCLVLIHNLDKDEAIHVPRKTSEMPCHPQIAFTFFKIFNISDWLPMLPLLVIATRTLFFLIQCF